MRTNDPRATTEQAATIPSDVSKRVNAVTPHSNE